MNNAFPEPLLAKIRQQKIIAVVVIDDAKDAVPLAAPYGKPVAVYHALPHGVRDALRQPVEPHFYTDITDVLARKRALLACHASQKDWLDATQGMDAYLDDMERLSREVGKMSGRFKFAEGWRRHSHLGFGPDDFDPVQDLLKR